MESCDLVDAWIPVRGIRLPVDHRLALSQALLVCLPWLAEERDASIGPVRLSSGAIESSGPALGLLSSRSRLTLRLRRERLDALRELDGRALDLGEPGLVLGTARTHELIPHATLYASYVCAPAADEAAFIDGVEQALDQLQVRAQVVCGRPTVQRMPEGPRIGYSLMLHGLAPQASLRLQARGLGPHRLLGCGMFLPHKSAAAVGIEPS